MTQLNQEKCVACRRDSPQVTEREAEEFKTQIPEWALVSEDGIRKLDRMFRFPNFQRALEFTNGIGEIAEEEGHHPRIVTEWGRVRVTWWTHAILGLHRNDFVMAAKSDELYERMEDANR